MQRPISLLLAGALAACGQGQPQTAAAKPPPVDRVPVEQGVEITAEDLPPADDPYVIVFLGDSLFAGFGLGEGEAAPDAFAPAFSHPQGVTAQIVNAGRDGGTAQRALEQFDRRVPQGADLVLIEFGANDIYAGRGLGELKGDLAALAQRARDMGARPVIVGMGPPPAGGRPQKGVWAEAAAEACADFYPYYFSAIIDADGRSLDRDYMLADGLHPNAEGARRIGEAIAGWTEKILKHHPPCGADGPAQP